MFNKNRYLEFSINVVIGHNLMLNIAHLKPIKKENRISQEL